MNMSYWAEKKERHDFKCSCPGCVNIIKKRTDVSCFSAFSRKGQTVNRNMPAPVGPLAEIGPFKAFQSAFPLTNILLRLLPAEGTHMVDWMCSCHLWVVGCTLNMFSISAIGKKMTSKASAG